MCDYPYPLLGLLSTPSAKRLLPAVMSAGRACDVRLPCLVAGVTILLALALLPRVLDRLSPSTGDEVYYLVTAASLWDDHRLNEARQWQTAAWRQFYPAYPLTEDFRGWPSFPEPLTPHASKTVRPPDELYSKHGLGVPLLIAPAYGLGGRAGALVLYAVLGGVLAANVYLLAYETTGNRAAATFAWAALSLSTPLFPYLLVIFPALPAALLTAYVMRWLLRWQQAGRRRRWTIGAALGFLPWLHTIFLLLTLPIAAALLWRDWRARSPSTERAARTPWRMPPLTTAWLLPLLLGLNALAAWHVFLYGRAAPNVQDHAGFNLPVLDSWAALRDSLGAMLSGVAGLVLDGQWGLVMHAPVYLAAAVGLVVVARQRPVLLAALALTVPYCLAVALYRQWWGEWCPPARYLAPVVPLAAAPLALLLAHTGRRGWTLAAALTAPGLAVTGLYAADPQLMFQHPTRVSVVAVGIGQRLGLPDAALLAAWLPSFIPQYELLGAPPAPLLRNLVWVVGTSLFVVGAAWWTRAAGVQKT